MKKIYLKISLFLFIFLFVFTNKSLSTTIVLDPGHGGTESGAVYGSVQEKDLNLQIAKYLRDYLEEYNTDVVLTHEGMWGYDLSIYDRAMIARNLDADLLVSLHLNSGTSYSTGAEVWVSNNKSHYKYNQFGTELGNKVLANLQSIGLANRGVKVRLCEDKTDVYTDGTLADYYGIIRYAMRGTKITNGVRYPSWKIDADIENGEGVSTILIEHCFMQSDYSYIDSDWDLWRLAEADGKAIVSQLGLRKKSDIVESISLDKQNLELFLDDNVKISATVLPPTATNKKVLWSSSDSSIASVDEYGNVVAYKAGKTVITAKTEDGNKTVQCTVYVQDILLNDTDVRMLDTDKRQIIASLTNEDSSYRLVWSSDDSSVATVSQDGLISAVGIGNTNVVVRIDGTSIYKNISVNVASMPSDEYVNMTGINELNGFITGIPEKTSKEELLAKFNVSSGLNIDIEMSGKFIGTDCKVVVKNKNSNSIYKEYVCLVYGDVNGDGAIKASDYVLIKNHIMEESRLIGNRILAADINGNEAITAADYVLVKNYIMGNMSIRNE